MFPYILLFLGIFLIVKFYKKKRDTYQEPTPSRDEQQPETNYAHSYKRKYLFSLNEKNEFFKLQSWANEHDLLVFPKVRLLDIIEPKNNVDNYKTLLWKIQAKHIDFVVCDKNCKIKYLIELDDNSHNRNDRQDRDKFLQEALRGAGYSLFHTKGINERFLSDLLQLRLKDV